MRRFTSLAAVALLAVLALGQFAWADTSLYGHYSQLNGTGTANNDWGGSSVTPDGNGNPRAPTACAPTATMNSFQMLENRYGVTGLVDDFDPYSSINELADAMGTQGDPFYNPSSNDYQFQHGGGTSAAGMVNGKIDYINSHQTGGPEIVVHGQSLFGSFNPNGTLNTSGTGTTPTAAYLKEQLDAGQDVEIWESWWDEETMSYNGAHIITATDVTWDPNTMTGTIEFVDPWGESGTAVDVNGTLTMHGSYVQIHYPAQNDGGADPDNPDNPGDEMVADIAMILAESPVPEPTTIGLLCIGMTFMLRRRAA